MFYIIGQDKIYSMSNKIFVISLLSLWVLLSKCPHKDYGAPKCMLAKAFSLWTLFQMSSNDKTSKVEILGFILFSQKKDNLHVMYLLVRRFLHYSKVFDSMWLWDTSSSAWGFTYSSLQNNFVWVMKNWLQYGDYTYIHIYFLLVRYSSKS